MTNNTLFKTIFHSGILALAVFQAPAYADRPDLSSIAFLPVPLPVNTAPDATRDSLAIADDLYTLSESGRQSPDIDRTIARYQRSIQEIESSEGPYSAQIPQQAENLGDLYLEQGEPAKAAAAFEKSLHVMRTNQGLYAAGQQPLLRKLIDAQLAMNDLQRAHEFHESLYHLQQNLYTQGESGFIAAQLEWADWNVDRLLLDETIQATGGHKQRADLTQLMLEAQDSYIAVIEQLHNDAGDATDPRLIHAEKKLAAINYIANSKTKLSRSQAMFAQANDQNAFSNLKYRENSDEMAYFFNGSNALKRAIAYSLESPQPDYLSIADQMMTLGDWYLLFDRRAAALEIYADAFEVLVAVDASEEDVARVMTPGMPVNAPDTPSASQLLANADFEGYIDIEFQVSKFGSARGAEIIGTSDGSASPVTKALLRKIRQEKFRPAFINGAATSNENIKLRYYYSYN